MNEIVPNKKHKEPRVRWFLILVMALFLAGQVHTAYATPAAPVLLVNPTLQQCIEHVILADECFVCKPVKGWEISQTGQCPSGYEIIAYQSIMDEDNPVSCMEYPKNEWAFCSWGRYPTMTPEFSAVTVAPSLTEPVQEPTVFLPTFSATPPSPADTMYSFDSLFVLCVGCLPFIIMIGIIFMVIRRKKILTGTKRK